MLKRIVLLMLVGVMVFGCSSEKSETTPVEKTQNAPKPDSDVAISYTMLVSGIPMMGEMTFNQRYLTDGEIGRVEMESIIPVGDQVRTSEFATIVDLDNQMVHYVNDAAKTFASVPFPDSASIPPVTSPEITIKAEWTGQVDSMVGIQCEERDVAFTVSYKVRDQDVTTSMSGKLWVSKDFPGYNTFLAFQAKSLEKLTDSRMQSGGFLDFLTRFNLSRENLDSLYAALGGFPFGGDLEFKINEGLPQSFDLKTKLEVTDVSTDNLDTEIFAVPEDYTPVDLSQVMAPPK
ncbi:MAG: DUF4412 domain-containing protein [Candidatus Zixiibacteriota bacterium]